MLEVHNRFAARPTERDATLSKRARMRAREAWKRSLAGRANGTIDAWYGCNLFDEMIDYAVNFTFPWCTTFFLRYYNRSLTTDLCYSFKSELRGHV
jgi:hypothetical protein